MVPSATRSRRSGLNCTGDASEIDAHDVAALARVKDLSEARGSEHLHGADMQLTPRDLLIGSRDHRIRLEGSRAARPGEVDRCLRQLVRDSPASIPDAYDEAGHRPHGLVVRVLVAATPDGTREVRIIGTRLDRAPCGRLTVGIGDDSARRSRVRMSAVGLIVESKAQFVGSHLVARYPAQLVPLALTPRRVATLPEDGLEVVPRGRVGRNDANARGDVVHAFHRNDSSDGEVDGAAAR